MTGAPTGRLFVPFTLPGERWRARPSGRSRAAGSPPRSSAWTAPSASPVCPHFGTCGGCRLQHLPAGAYTAFKRDRVCAALAKRGLGDAPVEEVRTARRAPAAACGWRWPAKAAAYGSASASAAAAPWCR